MDKRSAFYRYSFVWVTFLFFAFSLLGHWLFAWYAYHDEARDHGTVAEFGAFLIEVMRDTLENWQSEFLQLIWQVAGLSFLISLGSPQSKEGDERKEEKLDAILKKLDPKEAEKIIATLDRKYPKG